MVVLNGTLFLLVLGAVGALVAERQTANSVSEQEVFHEYEPFRFAVPLPQNVLRVLLRTKEVK